eukprot:s2847_g6.t1
MQKATVWNMPIAPIVAKNWGSFVDLPKQVACLFYWWEPDPTFLLLDPTEMTFPAHVKQEWARGIQTSAGQQVRIDKYVSYDLQNLAPNIVALVQAMDIDARQSQQRVEEEKDDKKVEEKLQKKHRHQYLIYTDNSATVEAGSAGKFKYHHDTNKNLKFVHVFPKIASEAPTVEQPAADEAGPRVAKTPEELLLENDEADFTRFLQTHLVTYAQKRKALELLKQRIAVLEEIELKLSRLERLSDEEQKLFEGIGSEDLRQKVKQVNLELQAMVEANRLSSSLGFHGRMDF